MDQKVVVVRNPRNGTKFFLGEVVDALKRGFPVQIDSGCLSVSREASYTEESYLRVRSEVSCSYRSGDLTIFPVGGAA